ncbi:L-threonylcarbamoyladenylate synthase [Dethiosulfovibrio salsuginis]|uniref:Threonylcarbamoyl-AMP synthase n=1 Tax=Dethiosulfovibrio salsuginis TaxID=561720 RepID=A0A1X7JA72_9BACT|nr:L-threonylcarbamoyladenylate synthase [Dethiosulfovibrio salsuginis]SMG24246.1 L-threonylcarbamoyladenylate synthase [Dethiosulfovibrio salsuginis]
MIVKLDRWNPDKEAITSAVKILKSGGLVAFPTETVYGLGANGLDGKAVSSIYSAKGRPSDNPLILHFGSPEDVVNVATVDERAKKIMDLFWPGPLTLVLPVNENVPEEVTAGLGTVGVRMPSHPVALALLQACRFPVAAPSANASGRPSPTDAQTVAADLKERVHMILDGGPTDLGLESTVLDVTGDTPVLLRPGGFPLEALVELLGPIAMPKGELELKRSPGTRYRHYAPSLPMRIQFPSDPFPVEEGEKWAFVGMDHPSLESDRSILFDDLDAYGRGLFAAMRELERLPLDVIIAQWPGDSGVGLAIRDRLIRASGLS